MAQHRSNEASKRLQTIPGIGVIGATAIAATGAILRLESGSCRGRISPGSKQKLGPISKQGDQYLRRILVGAHAILRRAKENSERYSWLTQLLARRAFKVVAVALANKMVRVAWALLARGGGYRAPAIVAAA